MNGVQEDTLATQIANHVTAVVKEAQMKILVLDPVIARYSFCSSYTLLSLFLTFISRYEAIAARFVNIYNLFNVFIVFICAYS